MKNTSDYQEKNIHPTSDIPAHAEKCIPKDNTPALKGKTLEQNSALSIISFLRRITRSIFPRNIPPTANPNQEQNERNTILPLEYLIDLISHRDSEKEHYQERQELLCLTASMFRSLKSTSYLLVWLRDQGAKAPELRLDQMFACEPVDGCSVIREIDNLRGVKKVLPVDDRTRLDATLIKEIIGLPHLPTPLQQWLIDRGVAVGNFSEMLQLLESHPSAVMADSKNIDDHGLGDVGVLQMLTVSRTEATASDSEFRLMARAISGRIESSRRYRIWNAQADFHREVTALPSRIGENLNQIPQILEIAARTVGQASRAEYVTVDYLTSPNCPNAWHGEYQPVDGIPFDVDEKLHSILVRALTKYRCPIRIDNIYDEREMRSRLGEVIPKEFGPWPKRNEKLAWMGIPVSTPTAHETNKVETTQLCPVCAIHAYGKSLPGYIYCDFSDTDFRLAKIIADALAQILPVTELRLALQSISENFNRERDGIAIDFDVAGILDQVTMLLPCATHAAVISEKGILETTQGCNHRLLEENFSRIANVIDQEILTLSPRDSKNKPHIFVSRFYRSDSHYAHLVIGLMGNEMPQYRQSIVRYLCQGAAVHMLERFRYEKNLKEIVEIRHAVRSGLNGVSGHLSLAHQRYNQFRKEPVEIAYRNIVSSSAMRRSLERAYMFAEKTRILLEEPRFLLDDLSEDKLKITHFDIWGVIKSVAMCLSPEAEDRECRIVTDIRGPEEYFKGKADYQLYYVLLFNVLENAVKYSHRHQNIRISLTCSSDTWLVEITNVGVPIPEDRAKQIFEPFVRGGSMTTPDARRPGTGLGLAVAERILKAHDRTRRITFDSRPAGDKGAARTVFKIPMVRRPLEKPI